MACLGWALRHTVDMASEYRGDLWLDACDQRLGQCGR